MEKTSTEVEALLVGIQFEPVLVGIVMGSESDREIMSAAGRELDERRIRHEVSVLSAHRDPDKVGPLRAHRPGARPQGADRRRRQGRRAAGVIASYTNLPVIGVPIKTSDLGGLDPLLSIVQMPPGVLVACVAINGARNAAILAAKILYL